MANKLKKDLSRGLSRLHSRMIGNDKEFEKAVAGYNPSSFCVGFDYAMNLVKGLLTQMPDAVEVVHGRWVDVSLSFTHPKAKCSVCGGIVYACGYNYCPNCGAEMRTKEGE